MNRAMQESIVNELLRLSISKDRAWGIAGRMLKNFNFEKTLETLQRMQPGFPLPYILGAVRNECQRTLIQSDMRNIVELMRG